MASICRTGWNRRPKAGWSSSGRCPRARRSCPASGSACARALKSWRELLVDLKAGGLAAPPKLAVGDGALGFWKALDEIFPGALRPLCWFHEISNVLNHFPKAVQPAVAAGLREISHADTRWQTSLRSLRNSLTAALAAIETFKETYRVKYERGVACLIKDAGDLTAFYDFAAEHRDHLRMSNPIESAFAAVRHRTVRTKGALSQRTASPWSSPLCGRPRRHGAG
jgi:putative transposase